MENAIENTQVEVTNEVEVDQFAGLKFSKESFSQLVAIVREQQERIEALESKNQTSSKKREMTIDDATRVVIGDLREKTHNECTVILGLSYGQVYSARLGHTFKPVMKQMIADGLENIWEKKAKA